MRPIEQHCCRKFFICFKNMVKNLIEALDFIKYESQPFKGKTAESSIISKIVSFTIYGFIIYALVQLFDDFYSKTLDTTQQVGQDFEKSNDLNVSKTPIMIQIKNQTQNLTLVTINAFLVNVKRKNGLSTETRTPIELIPCSQSVVNQHPQKYKTYLKTLKDGWYCLPADKIYKLYDKQKTSQYQYLSFQVVACDNSTSKCADEAYINNYLSQNKYFQLLFSYREVFYNVNDLVNFEIDTINSQKSYKFYPLVTFQDDYFLESVEIDEYKHRYNPFASSITSSSESSTIVAQEGGSYPQTGAEYLKIGIRPSSKFKKMVRHHPNIMSLLEHIVTLTMAFFLVVKIFNLYCQLCRKIRIFKDRYRYQNPNFEVLSEESEIDKCCYFSFFHFIGYIFYKCFCPQKYDQPEERRQILQAGRDCMSEISRLTAEIKQSQHLCDTKTIYDRLQNLNAFFVCFMTFLEELAAKAEQTAQKIEQNIHLMRVANEYQQQFNSPERQHERQHEIYHQRYHQRQHQRQERHEQVAQVHNNSMVRVDLERQALQRADKVDWWQKKQYMENNLEIASLMLLRTRLKNVCFPYRVRSLRNFLSFNIQAQITPEFIQSLDNSIKRPDQNIIRPEVSQFFTIPAKN